MNIKILDSWLREYLETKATPQVLAEKLSLTSVSVERVEPFGKDTTYEIEVTTNRPDLMSIIGLARESAAILPQFGIGAKFLPPTFKTIESDDELTIEIQNDPKLVNRICAAILEVTQKESPQFIKDRLETAGIRSLNNLVDITNYVMLEVGHPTHVFDYDRLSTKKLIIRESKKGEKIITLDGKEHSLQGGDIVADDGTGKIVDLLGIMGTQNSVVAENTKRILFFLDNNEPTRIRKTSMGLAIRTDAATLNEKGIDPCLAIDALKRGVELYCKLTGGKLVSGYIDIFPNKPKAKKVSVSFDKINRILGITISPKTATEMLNRLGFQAKINRREVEAEIPTQRLNDIEIEEDLIEEIARVYGYHNLPSELQQSTKHSITSLENNEFYFEKRAKEAMKYWGFTEVYTYSMVSEELFDGPLDQAIEIDNPLSEEWKYMRRSLVPSLLQVIYENKRYKKAKLFEIANVCKKQGAKLPIQTLTLAGVIQGEDQGFYRVKGVIEQIFSDLGLHDVSFKKRIDGLGAEIYIKKEHAGEIEILDDNLVDFELNFEAIVRFATLKKVYKPLPKFPPILEDVSLIVNDNIQTGDIIKEIQKQNSLITSVELLDQYLDTRTFHIVYQHKDRNLTNEEVAEIRERILKHLKQKFQAEVK